MTVDSMVHVVVAALPNLLAMATALFACYALAFSFASIFENHGGSLPRGLRRLVLPDERRAGTADRRGAPLAVVPRNRRGGERHANPAG